MPAENVNHRSSTRARSIRRVGSPSASRSRCSVASMMSFGIPRIRQKTLDEPPGNVLSGVSEPTRPLAASLTVPSPPKATTTS